MGFTFDIILNTEQPFIVELDTKSQLQTLTGDIVLQLDSPEKFKVAKVDIHGHIGVALNIDTKPVIVHERLVGSTFDLIAANDTEGHGTIRVPESGTQYLPFRIDLPHPDVLPPTLINKLDTHYIDWKYEIHATLQRDSIFSSTRIVKHDLILRRPIPTTVGASEDQSSTPLLTASTDLPKQFRCKVTIPSRISLNQEKLRATVDMKARHKSFMIKEIDIAVVQTEDINYTTKRGHPNVENAQEPGASCTVKGSRLVSSIKKVENEDFDLDFGRKKPLELDIRLDNFQLIPSEHSLDWLNISHIVRFTVYFMDVNLPPNTLEMPLIVDHEGVSAETITSLKSGAEARAATEAGAEAEAAGVTTTVKNKSVTRRLIDSLDIFGSRSGSGSDSHSDRESTPEAD
ncbi:hypothetical protein BX616_002416 [Lobosporangium transversale]|uniref:Arrestin C-terminal-like domain-containing protein n=1 Tax=Lobosporangium transversale TaxID=64571 RepID=A0A1Y2GEX3_9FUNG|nr:hypothetical protein BCR41DRAFT_359139 [Lobosporangium transversale]KAF9916931.1 hypothetical protein BX616_002416 [Lobosporangium transversale]ORZ08852.1 hypothetical protein BCR41DRAFT_359139 [Lobosporangium transversale]|eukprot:XP_021878635.1 hypothetical protein BCR41DRAFT_359139 [Lobosporangium transversale]